MSERPVPPEVLRRRLERRLPRGEREIILNELDDLYALRVERDGRPAADLWYQKQLMNFPSRLFADRAGRLVRSAIDPDVWRGVMSVESMVRDLKYALRRLARAPGFSAVAVLSLALGIGANTAMFSIVNAIMLSDPPLAEVEELVDVYTSDSSGTLYGTFSYPDYEDLRDQSNGVFEGVSAARTFIAAAGDPSRPEVIVGEAISPNHFSLMGLPMVLGRSFGPEDDGPSASSRVAILNHGTWKREFGSDPNVLGQSYRLNQTDFTIVGVAPEWYTGSFPAFHSGVFVPINMTQLIQGEMEGVDPNTRRGSRSLFVRARLADGISVDQANAWMGGFANGLEENYPDTNSDRIYSAIPLTEILVHPIVDKALLPVAGFLMAIVGIVLLIACVNLASFLLARAEQRRREIAVRLSLGASRTSLIRQLLVETVLLGGLGGLGGLLLARWSVDALVSVRPPIPIPINLDFPLDGTVLTFTLLVSLGAGVFFGLIPALQATKPQIAGTLREESGASTGRGRLRGMLVVAQVSLSVVLLVGSGLFLRSLLNAQDADPGFYHDEAAIIWPNLQLSGFSDQESSAFWPSLEEKLLATPGITHVGYTDLMPLGLGVQTQAIDIPGLEGDRSDGLHDIDKATVSAGFFATLEIEVLRGRNFGTPEMGAEAAASIIVSREFEARYFPDGAVGRTVGTGGDSNYEIIGVVADSKVRTIGEEVRPKMYLSALQMNLGSYQVVTRGTGTSGEILRRTVEATLELNPGVVLFDQRTMEEHTAVHLFPPRMAAALLSIFGGLALLLAAVGIWGVVSHAVASRTREVGIRVSMGASGGSIVRLLVGNGMRVVLIGIGVGLALSAAAGFLVSGFLFGVAPLDAVSFIGIPTLLAAVALAAAWIPASRAAHVDPVKALRSE